MSIKSLVPPIRIEPDWNVMALMIHFPYTSSSIRIEPDWNVKFDGLSIAPPSPHIRIEPDWNVKILVFCKYSVCT